MNLGGLGIYWKLRNVFRKSYVQNEYWGGDAGEKHFDQRQRTDDESTGIQLEFLAKYLKTIEFKNVFEVACGYGRMTKVINDNFVIKNYYAIDINFHQITHAREICKDYNIKWIHSPIQDYNPKRMFDLVFGAEILLHVIPSEIQSFVDHIISFSNNHVIFMDMGKKFQIKLKNQKFDKFSNCFCHDLNSIFLKNSQVKSVTEHKASEKSSLYHLIIHK